MLPLNASLVTICSRYLLYLSAYLSIKNILNPNPSPIPIPLHSTSNFATYGDVLLCKAHYHQLFQVKGNYSELARQTERYAISGSTERLIQAGEITEEEAKQMMIIQAEVDGMVEGTQLKNDSKLMCVNKAGNVANKKSLADGQGQ